MVKIVKCKDLWIFICLLILVVVAGIFSTTKGEAEQKLSNKKIEIVKSKDFVVTTKKKNVVKKKNAYKKFKKIKSCRWSKNKQWNIYKICKKYNISFEMCISQAYQESTWNEKASGDNGLAYGAWQIHPSAWKHELARWGYSYNDMYNLYNACNVYCKIMVSHFRKYDNVYFALMAWRWGGNDGMRRLKNYGEDLYSTSIVSRAKKYEDR